MFLFLWVLIFEHIEDVNVIVSEREGSRRERERDR